MNLNNSTIARKKTENKWLQNGLPQLVQEMMENSGRYGDIGHLKGRDLPSKQAIVKILNDFMKLLFPSFYAESELTKSNIQYFLTDTLHSLHGEIAAEIEKCLRYASRRTKGRPMYSCMRRAQKISSEILENLPRIRTLLAGDIRAAYNGDPAAKSPAEIILSYPCVYAITVYRIAHEFYIRKIPIMPRLMSEQAHSMTGIDLHPGARIGRNFFIDHGTGVVIGETTEIGNNVRIYQGVTLGGQSFATGEISRLRGKKRHPTIEDDVIIYAGATILGGKTVIGKGAVIGGNVWITSSIPPNTTITIAPPKLTLRENHKDKEPKSA
jgi:serine O-acetyltransferase